jgi:hypothetical protein
MPQAQGSRITPETALKKTRRIPTQGTVLVNMGELVAPNTVVARGHVPNPEIQEVKFYVDLGVDPERVERYLLKNEGEEVRKNEVIAFRRSFFGLSMRESRSPIEGTIEHFSNITGKALIRGKPIPIEVKAHIPGKVIEVIPKEGAVIESPAAHIQGVFGIGGETHGMLVTAVKTPDEVVSPDKIHVEHKGKILVGGSLLTLDALEKAVETGVKGVISGGVDQKELTTFLGYEIGVGITGDEESGLTLILTEGFGQHSMDDEIFQLLRSHEGNKACIDGSTQIRLRAIRPEIILPLENPKV